MHTLLINYYEQLYFGHMCYKNCDLSRLGACPIVTSFAAKVKLATPFWAVPKPILPTVRQYKKD
jgi:hypothetical protein